MSAMPQQQSIFQPQNAMVRWLCAAVFFCVLSVESFAAPDIEANSDALAADVLLPAGYAAFPAATNLVTNGPVLASASFGSSTGEDTGHGVAIDVNTALIDPRFPKVEKLDGSGNPVIAPADGHINAIIEDGLGGWVIGGDFTHVGGIALNNLAYIQADLTVSSAWRPNPNNVVYALRFHTREAGLRLLVGGEFTEIHGEQRSYFAELHTGSISKPVTTLDLTLDGAVHAIATADADDEVEDRLVFIGGAFTAVQGKGPRDSNGDGQLDVDINGLVGIDLDGDGIFETTKQIDADGIFDIDVDGDGDIDIDVDGDGNVNQDIDVKYDLSGTALDIPFEQIYPPSDDERQSIAALDLNVTSNAMVVREWNPNVNGPVYAMALSGVRGRLYIGGDFDAIAIDDPVGAGGDVGRRDIAELDVTTELNVLTPWNPGEPETTSIHSMLLQEFTVDEETDGATGLLYVGGAFERIGGQNRDNFAVLDISLAINSANSWDLDFSGVVTSLAQTNDTVYVGGEFTAVDGDINYAYLAGILTVDGSLDTSWNPSVTGDVTALATEEDGDILFAGGRFTTVDDDSRLYIGGDFTYIGPSTGSGVVVSTTGDVQSDWPEIDGDIYTAISDGADGWYIGGSFSRVGAAPRNNIAHIDSAKTVTADWNPNANGPVRALALSGTTLYVGGEFTGIDTVSRNRLAALDTKATVAGYYDTGWNPNANGTVYALAVNSLGDLYVGGGFTAFTAGTRDYLAKFNSTGSLQGWNPDADNIVRALAINTFDHLYVGGDFTSFTAGTIDRNYLARFNGDVLQAWDPDVDGAVHVLEMDLIPGSDLNDLYVGGDFSSFTAGTDFRNNVARFNNAGELQAWAPNANGRVTALMLDGTTLYVGGDFTFIGHLLRNRAAAFDLVDVGDEDVSTIWNPSVGNTVHALSPGSANVFIGGAFSSVGGVTRERLAAIDSSSGLLSANFNVGSNGAVRDMVISRDGETLYVGGDFTAVGGQSRDHLAALRTASGSAWAWNPGVGGGASTTVHDIELSSEETLLYVAGEFEAVGGEVRNNLAEIDVITGGRTEWDPSVDGAVYAIALNGDTLFVGGDFSYVNTNGQNVFRSNLAALNITQKTNNATAWAPAVDGPVYDIESVGSTLYIGGDFRFINDSGLTQARDYLAALDSSANAFNLLSWNPAANGRVDAIALTDDAIFVGGDFTEINGVSRERLAALDFVDGTPLPWWDLRADATVRDLGISGADDRMIIGGDFKQITTTTATEYLREGLTTVDVGFPRVVTNPPAGAYASTQTGVTMNCVDMPRECSQNVFYTINSNIVPSVLDSLDSQAIGISANTILQLITQDDAGNQSEIQTMFYVIDEDAPVTTATLDGPLPDGRILSSNDDLDIVLDCVDTGGAGCAEIYYTTDGTKPTDASLVYTGPITLSQNTTLKYFAFDQARNDEAVINTEQYWLDLAAPVVVADPPTQVFYGETLEVTLLCSDDTEVTAANIGDIPDASNPPQPNDPPVTGEESVDENERVITGCKGVYYTLDDSTPTTASALYTGPIQLSDSTVMKFIAEDHAGNEGVPQRASYIKNYSENVGAIGPLGGGILLLPWLYWRLRSRHRLVLRGCCDRGLV